MINKPNFFIVGAPRCGTTAMYEFLKVHPQIYMSSYKEPHYFASDLTPSTPWMKSLKKKKHYMRLFRGAKDENMIGEASVFYLFSKTAARNIKKFNSGAKIIIMLRSPVEIIYSLYYQRLGGHQENVSTFEKALRVESKRKKGKMIPANTLDMKETYYYNDLAKLGQQVKRYYDVFDKHQIHTIIYEDFAKDVAGVYRNLLQFLEVDPNFTPVFRVVNSSKSTRFTTLQNLLTQSNLIRRIYQKYYPLIKPLSTRILELNRQNTTRPPLDPLLERVLLDQCKTDVRKLSKLIGKDVLYWCK